MQRSLEKYRRQIQSGQINPLVHWDGRRSGVIFDPTDDSVPLEMLSFAAYRLEDGPFTIETGPREYALIPVDARYEVTVGREVFRGHRAGGPFATLPASSNAEAVYVPAGVTCRLAGQGELVAFAAPAAGQKPPTQIRPGQRPNLRRGTAAWHRDIVTLFSPENVTTSLIGGETYSPPALWSGTPPHVHDRDDPAGGQSDHEEVYYHLARVTEGRWGAYGVQLLFDDQGLDKAYLIHHRSAFAIPGAAHPVVSGPVSDMLYIWALTGPSSRLAMLDVDEFAYLKSLEQIIDHFEAQRGVTTISQSQFQAAVRRHGLDDVQATLCRLHLLERGFAIQ
ncbi:MAG: 5-deoxy-glucuronate isomerase [Phycisphaerae bacterium]